MEIRKLKSIERKKFKTIRGKSTLEERNNIKKNVEIFINSYLTHKKIIRYLAIYWPLKNEIDLRFLKEKYPVALPKCQPNKQIEFFIWDDTSLKDDIHGIPSPDNGRLLNSKEVSIIFVPCLSIDKELIRLGYGGGYFDRLRNDLGWRSIPCIGILTETCVSKNLLIKAEWDIPLSGFITDKRISV